MISSKNECVFIRALSDFTLPNIVNAWWASMNVDSKCPITWNKSRHAPLWRFYLHCGIEETGSPGNIYIICHQVRCHPSDHGTGSRGKHLLANAHIAILNKYTELEVTALTSSTVDETSLAILRSQGSRGITIVTSHRKFILDIDVLSIYTELTDKMLQTGGKGLWNFRMSSRHMESQPDVRICFGLYPMEHCIESRAKTVLYSITTWLSAALRNDP